MTGFKLGISVVGSNCSTIALEIVFSTTERIFLLALRYYSIGPFTRQVELSSNGCLDS